MLSFLLHFILFLLSHSPLPLFPMHEAYQWQPQVFKCAKVQTVEEISAINESLLEIKVIPPTNKLCWSCWLKGISVLREITTKSVLQKKKVFVFHMLSQLFRDSHLGCFWFLYISPYLKTIHCCFLTSIRYYILTFWYSWLNFSSYTPLFTSFLFSQYNHITIFG